jgi:hypothetical protein
MGILLLDQFAHEQPLRLTVGDNEVLGNFEVVLVGDLVIRRAGQRVVARTSEITARVPSSLSAAD